MYLRSLSLRVQPFPGRLPPCRQERGQHALPIATGRVKSPSAGAHLGQRPPLSPAEVAALVAEAVRQVQATPVGRH
jgi:hypothetical protein